MHQIAAEVGTWDVFILNAGHTPEPGPIARTNLSDYWKAYEVHCPTTTSYSNPHTADNTTTQTNVKSVIIAALAFIPTANRAHATMLGVMAGAICFSPAGSPGLSAYLNSKIAKLKTLEFLAAENPRIFVASVHPGMVDTGIFQRSGAKPELFPMDSGEFLSLPLVVFTNFLDCDLSACSVLHDVEAGSCTLFVDMESTLACLHIASSSYLVRTFHGLALQPRSSFPAREICVGKLGCGRVESCSVEDTREPPYGHRYCRMACITHVRIIRSGASAHQHVEK